jgi:HEAT repeat protein
MDCAVRLPDSARVFAHSFPPDGPLAGAAALIGLSIRGSVVGDEGLDEEFLTVAVSNPDTLVRSVALEALSAITRPGAVEAIAFAINDEAQEVQFSALRALGACRDERVRPAAAQHLVRFLKDARDDSLRVVAIEALGETGSREAQQVLRSYVTVESARLAVAAVEVLARLAAHGAAVTAALAHADAEVVKAALRVLERYPNEVTADEVAKCLSHEAWDVRRLSADVMASVGGERAVAELTRRLGEEQEPLVLDALRRALASIQGVRPSLLAPRERSST